METDVFEDVKTFAGILFAITVGGYMLVTVVVDAIYGPRTHAGEAGHDPDL